MALGGAMAEIQVLAILFGPVGLAAMMVDMRIVGERRDEEWDAAQYRFQVKRKACQPSRGKWTSSWVNMAARKNSNVVAARIRPLNAISVAVLDEVPGTIPIAWVAFGSY